MKTAPQPLKFSNPQTSEQSPVTVLLTVDGGILTARYDVRSKTIFGKKELGRKEYPFDFDVVEIFVTGFPGMREQYFEFEVTPYNQGLQVNVFDPRQEFHFGVKNGFEHTAKITATGWEAEIRVSLKTLGWDGHAPLGLRGNVFAALGEGASRTFWSLFALPPGKPDFHVPAAFQALFP